jgi:hypothetical protein
MSSGFQKYFVKKDCLGYVSVISLQYNELSSLIFRVRSLPVGCAISVLSEKADGLLGWAYMRIDISYYIHYNYKNIWIR